MGDLLPHRAGAARRPAPLLIDLMGASLAGLAACWSVLASKPALASVALAALAAQFCRSALVRYRHQRRVARLTVDARTDPLTGVLNRSGFAHAAQALTAVTSRVGGTLALTVIDLDGFKRLNDTRGHAAGDALLQRAAGALVRAARRSTDVVARLGGDEFVVVCALTDEEEVRMLAGRVRALLLDALAPDASASFGVAVRELAPGCRADPADLLSQMLTEADDAMYCDKIAADISAMFDGIAAPLPPSDARRRRALRRAADWRHVDPLSG